MLDGHISASVGGNLDKLKSFLPWAAIALLASIILAGFDPAGAPFSGLIGYLVLALAGAALIWAIWTWLQSPRWLLVVLGAGVVLRLIVGIGLYLALPEYGYESVAHKEGYLFYDAYKRDADAWHLARTAESPLEAFSRREQGDQYGGISLLMVVVYRTFSPSVHRPLLIVEIAAAASALAILFGWAFARLAFGSSSAKIAAWILALYPEFVLLGSSHMREPYLIAGMALALYGYSRLRMGSYRSGGVLVVVGGAVAGALSPPTLVLIMGIIGFAVIWEGKIQWRRARLPVLTAGVLVIFAVVFTAQVWSSLANMPEGNTIQTIGYWLTGGAKFEIFMLERDSGWVQYLFDRTPEWTHFVMATGNGLVQPFLPAAIADNSSLPLPRAIGILRAAGWFFLLPFIIYAPFAAVKNLGGRSLHAYLSIAIWATALLASFRLAGDQWDNPRARAIGLAMQAAIAGWAWVHARSSSSPWLKRMALLVVGSSVIFLHWYIGRYYHTPRLSLVWTTLVTGVYALGLLGISLLKDRRPRAQARGLTESPPKV
jgi:4-amino-4-deoxy-L-arabinose transferase-like glycosyltransferase